MIGRVKDNLTGFNERERQVSDVKPNPETARALEAQVREQILKQADDATYVRRNAAIEQERAVKENELNNEIAVETKKRQIRETQMEAERTVLAKRQAIQDQELAGRIALEDKNRSLTSLRAENARTEADARAYAVAPSRSRRVEMAGQGRLPADFVDSCGNSALVQNAKPAIMVVRGLSKAQL
jgi:hypothetical protein